MFITKHYNTLPRTIGGIMEDLFQNKWENIWNDEQVNVPVNIEETDQAYELKLVAPGIKKEEIKVNVDKNVLTISYEHKEEKKSETGKTLRTEYTVKSFKRNFTLNDRISISGIVANYADGLLSVTLPKKEVTQQTAQEITVS